MTATYTLTPWIGDLDAIDHTERAPGLLLWQYQDKPRMLAYLDILMGQVNSLEDLSQQLLVERSIDTAIGVQLDTIGKIVDLLRGTLTDSEYRLFLRGKVYCNVGDGQGPQFIYLLVDILGFEYAVIDEYSYGEVNVFASGVVHDSVVFALLQLLVGSGIRLAWVYSPQLWSRTFRTSDALGADDVTADYGTAELGDLVVVAAGGYVSGSKEVPT